MSIAQIVKVWDHEFAHNEQSVMIALADFANDEGQRIYPSIARVAWKTGYDERTIQRTLRKLTNKGVLAVQYPSTSTQPTTFKFDWTKAKPKPSFTEYKKLKSDKKRKSNPDPQLDFTFDDDFEIDLGGDNRSDTGVTNDPLGVTNATLGGDKLDTFGVTSTTPWGDTHVTRSVIDPLRDPSKDPFIKKAEEKKDSLLRKSPESEPDHEEGILSKIGLLREAVDVLGVETIPANYVFDWKMKFWMPWYLKGGATIDPKFALWLGKTMPVNRGENPTIAELKRKGSQRIRKANTSQSRLLMLCDEYEDYLAHLEAEANRSDTANGSNYAIEIQSGLTDDQKLAVAISDGKTLHRYPDLNTFIALPWLPGQPLELPGAETVAPRGATDKFKADMAADIALRATAKAMNESIANARERLTNEPNRLGWALELLEKDVFIPVVIRCEENPYFLRSDLTGFLKEVLKARHADKFPDSIKRHIAKAAKALRAKKQAKATAAIAS